MNSSGCHFCGYYVDYYGIYVKMAPCFQPTLQTFKHRYVCVLCPELIHIYLNCNIVDALVTTDRQF